MITIFVKVNLINSDLINFKIKDILTKIMSIRKAAFQPSSHDNDEKQKEQKQPQQRMSWQSRQEAGSSAKRFRPRRILKLNGSNQSKHKIKESFADKDQRKTKELVHT